MGYFGDEDENREMFSVIGGGYYYPEADLFLPDIDPEEPEGWDGLEEDLGYVEDDDFIDRDLYGSEYRDYYYEE